MHESRTVTSTAAQPDAEEEAPGSRKAGRIGQFMRSVTLADLYECVCNGIKCPACGANASGIGWTSDSYQCVLAECGHEWNESNDGSGRSERE